jgi:pimeloyl-ACP methyl ester carboxylesterase
MVTAAPPASLFVELETGPDVAASLGSGLRIFAELSVPAGGAPDLLLVCLPGGGMNRHYFNLPTPDGETTASFAAAMAGKGFAVAMLDPLGVGDSGKPEDAYALTPDMHVRALVPAIDDLLQRLRSGNIPGLPAWPELRSVGVGHSFGCALTVALQAYRPTHAGLALFGFGLVPMPRYAGGAELALPDATLPVAEAKARMAQSVRSVFSAAYLDLEPTGGERARILARANDRLLATAAYSAMMPFLFQADAAAIDVPVLLAYGDKDLFGPPQEIVRYYPRCNDIGLLILPETRHNHFIYPTRKTLFDRFAQWTQNL